MAEFYSNKLEEQLISRIISKDGLGLSNLPKYYVLRLALALSLRLPHLPLDSKVWDEKRLDAPKDKEYHLEQITGKGRAYGSDFDGLKDFDKLTRALLYIAHKDELEESKNDIFANDELYLDILGRHIHRGLCEIYRSWKGSDCFYQWSMDNLGLDSVNLNFQNPQNAHIQSMEYSLDFSRIKKYFGRLNIGIEHIATLDSYRHNIVRIHLLDSNKIDTFKKKAQNLSDELGVNVRLELVPNTNRNYDIQIPKDKWENIGSNEFLHGLDSIKGLESSHNFELGILAGFSIDRTPLLLDVAKLPHLFVAGTTGSGKSALLRNIIVSLLLNGKRPEIVLIDPKCGLDFKIFKDLGIVDSILDSTQGSEYLETLIEEMQMRYTAISSGKNIESFGRKVAVIDELNAFVMREKGANDKLVRLAQEARAAGIHLILGTQRPDAEIFSGGLRSNIPARIALQVVKESESRIILDESGAEKLLGSGDMLVKSPNLKLPKRAIAPYLNDSDITHLLRQNVV